MVSSNSLIKDYTKARGGDRSKLMEDGWVAGKGLAEGKLMDG